MSTAFVRSTVPTWLEVMLLYGGGNFLVSTCSDLEALLATVPGVAVEVVRPVLPR